MDNLIDENKCLHCGEGKPGYCEECHQKLIAENAELQKERDGIYEDYQDLGKDYHKLDCELEVKDKVIREMAKKIRDVYFKNIEEFYEWFELNIMLEKRGTDSEVDLIEKYFYGKVREDKKDG